MPQTLLIVVLVVMNVAALGTCVADKIQAKRHARRIPERTLLLLALVGGTAGLFLGMVLARHKVRKLRFLAWFFAIAFLQTVAFLVLRARGIV